MQIAPVEFSVGVDSFHTSKLPANYCRRRRVDTGWRQKASLLSRVSLLPRILLLLLHRLSFKEFLKLAQAVAFGLC